jgi:hypothetical protein
MNIRIENGLPFVSVALAYKGKQLALNRVLLDTGSAGTIFSADKVAEADLFLDPHDTIHRIRGIGGSEFVFTKHVDSLTIGELQVGDFEIEIGAMEYNLDIEAIIGMDFLMQVGAIIDLAQLQIHDSLD